MYYRERAELTGRFLRQTGKSRGQIFSDGGMAYENGGITASSFRRGYAMIWENVRKILRGEKPMNVGNGR